MANLSRQSAVKSLPIKWHGGKHYLAKRIIELMPPRAKNSNAPAKEDPGWLHYVEPFAGGLAVLLANDPEGISEVVNDINAGLTTFWRVLQSPRLFMEFQRQLSVVPFSQAEFTGAKEECEDMTCGDPVDRFFAVNFFIHCRQSMSGRMDSFAPLVRNRTRRGMQEQVSAWLSAIEGLPEVHARLQRVAILHDDAVNVIQQQDGPRTLFYLDPPYLHETRTAKEVYTHEMTHDQHVGLLTTIAQIEGRFLLSGYRSDLYDSWAERCNWRRVDIAIDNKSGKGAKKQQRVECVWMNYFVNRGEQ